MDPFVVASLGRKTYRTRVIRHNLNPMFEEKMVFQLMRHEQNYHLSFSVVDRDKLSGNDFVGTANLALPTVIDTAPEADMETGLYRLQEPPDASPLPTANRSRFRLPLSRSSSSNSLNKFGRPGLTSRPSQNSVTGSQSEPQSGPTSAPAVPIDPTRLTPVPANVTQEPIIDSAPSADDPDLRTYTLPLILKNKERWETKHNPVLTIKAKYLPYSALRQQFWRAMLRQYDSDENAQISKLELTTMLDTLGSTLKESTIDGYFLRFANGNNTLDTGSMHLNFDQAVICLEEQLQKSTQKKSWGDTVKGFIDQAHPSAASSADIPDDVAVPISTNNPSIVKSNSQQDPSTVPQIQQDYLRAQGESGDVLERDDLSDDRGEEHVVEIRECPICHQPRLNKKSDADIITHIATCASQDWRQVNTLVMAGFVTSSQAQRKWYSKVITKISYGGYKLGANSANILVQDRITGQINEERMSVYVRLGIRLLYKGLKSREMEKKRSEFAQYDQIYSTVLTRNSSKTFKVSQFQTREEI